MPPVMETPSRSRVRFLEPEASMPAAVESGSSESHGGGVVAVPSGKCFELQEDPSFWKDNSVQVVIRIRPLSSSEVSLQGHNKCVRQDSCQSITWIGHPESRFTFDHVADEHVSQEKLFKVAGVPMVDNCVAGYNSCMFAYGQTGSGKTHTMLGDIEGGTRRHSVNAGMTPRVFEYLFSRIQKEKESRRDEKLRFTCKCSFLEIYNEQILDLLDPSSTNLQIREDARKGVYVENLIEFEVSSARDVIQQLVQGATNRKVASTNMNCASSRSHSVFTCIIESKWESQGVTHHRFARLNLVDLAGSERQKSSGAEGERLKEATNINKSLSTLGLVIMNLVSNANKKSLHVPYRDSKLTFLLQDSLGGNSKTIIIANISPSNCCALETLSTLKFAQRAKFIRNNAVVNEDASGDVLSMRMQIQQLKKEVHRLQGLVNGGSENQETDTMSIGFPGSPVSFKWDGGQGSFSPLTFDKRLSKGKEYEATLVASLKREKDKDAALKALTAGKQVAEQLASQKTEEVKGLKMRLRFREEGIKRLEAVASGKLSAESHLLQEREALLKEIDVLRNLVDRNPEVTRFAMENLDLKEELRRLQSLDEEGELERMSEQITVLQDKLLEALEWKLMHEKDADVVKDLSASWDSSVNEENEFLRLQAIQNQREVDSLRKNLSACLESKEKLERHIDELVSQLEERKTDKVVNEAEIEKISLSSISTSDDQMELKTMVEAIAAASQREAEAHETAITLAKENEEFRAKLKVLIEDNNKLIELYEGVVAEGAGNKSDSVDKSENYESLNNCTSVFSRDEYPNSCQVNHYEDMKDVEHLEHQLQEMHEENEKLMGLYEQAMQERDEFKRLLYSSEQDEQKDKDVSCPEQLAEVDEEKVYCNGKGEEFFETDADFIGLSKEKLTLARSELEVMKDMIQNTTNFNSFFGLFGKAAMEFHQFTNRIDVSHQDIQVKQQEIASLRASSSEINERKIVMENKFSALKFALQTYSKVEYWEEREVKAKARVNECLAFVEQKKEELTKVQSSKYELDTLCLTSVQQEVQLRENLNSVKLKYQDAESRRKETEKVLFTIDNLHKADVPAQRASHFGKASELLKSEEDRTKLAAEMKLIQEMLSVAQKENARSKKMAETLETKILNLEEEVRSASVSLAEEESRLQKATEEKVVLYEMREKGRSEVGNLLVDYQGLVFELDLKEAECHLLVEELEREMEELEGLKAEQHSIAQKMDQLMEENGCSLPMLSDLNGRC